MKVGFIGLGLGTFVGSLGNADALPVTDASGGAAAAGRYRSAAWLAAPP